MAFTVAHLIDDAALGGVTRSLADQLPGHRKDSTRHEIVHVNTAFSLPPRIEADAAVVHFTASWAKLPFMAALRRSLGRRPLVIQEHSYTEAFEQQFVPSRRRFRQMLRLTYRLADVVVAVSEGQRAWLDHAGLVRRGALVAIPQALDISRLLPIAPPVWDGIGPLRLGAYGRYNPQKGFDILIEAFRGIDPGAATLRIAGYGQEESRLRALCRGLGHVEVGGRIEGPVGFLSGVHAAVIPSRYEAFGLVALEVRAAARPFVATAVDGLVEQSDPRWAVPCRPLDVLDLRRAILSLRDRPLTEMGVAARRSVEGSLATNLGRWAALFDRLAAGCDGADAGEGLAEWETTVPRNANQAICEMPSH